MEEDQSEAVEQEPTRPEPALGWYPTSPIDRLAHSLSRLLPQYAATIVIVLVGISFLAPIALFVSTDPSLGVRYTLLTGVSILPAVIILLSIMFLDLGRTRSVRTVAFAIGLGMVLAGAAATINGMFRFLEVVPVIGMIVFFFLIVAPAEEAVKLLAVWLSADRRDRLQRVTDGAVYGAAAGLGFATVENFIYVVLFAQTVGEPLITAVRSLSGPGHVIWSAIAGFYLGLARLNEAFRGTLVIKGLLIAIAFHGIHNAASLYIADLRIWWTFQITWHLLGVGVLIGLIFEARLRQQRIEEQGIR